MGEGWWPTESNQTKSHNCCPFDDNRTGISSWQVRKGSRNLLLFFFFLASSSYSSLLRGNRMDFWELDFYQRALKIFNNDPAPVVVWASSASISFYPLSCVLLLLLQTHAHNTSPTKHSDEEVEAEKKNHFTYPMNRIPKLIARHCNLSLSHSHSHSLDWQIFILHWTLCSIASSTHTDRRWIELPWHRV